MPTKRLTQEFAERARHYTDKKGKPSDARYWDDRLGGFGLICRKSGLKTWVVQREIRTERGATTARQSLGHFPALSAQEARALAEATSSKMRGGHNPHDARSANLTLGIAFESYMRASVHLRPKTVIIYREDMERYVFKRRNDAGTYDARRWSDGLTWYDTPLSDVGKRAERVANLFADITQRHGKSSANGAMQILRRVYNWHLELNEQLPRNPVRPTLFRLHRLKPRKRVIPFDNYEAWARDVASLLNPIRRCGQLFILLSGMRVRATCEMRWKDVDWKAKTLRVPEPKGGELYEFKLPLSTQLIAILERLKLYSTAEWAFPGSPYCFPAVSNTGHVNHFKESRREHLINPHALRRTFTTRAADKVPKKHISFLVNHAQEEENMTDKYIVAEEEPLAQSQQIISDYIMGKLALPLEKILGPAHSGNKQTFGQTPPWAEE